MKSIFAIVGSINYLAVVFLNAFTDLGHKIIIQNTIFKVYDGTEQIIFTAMINAMILLPFILVFSPAGYLSDKIKKHIIMKYAAFCAIIITLLITFAYYQGWFFVAFGLTFILAMQSAIYSPAKYGYIKELYGEKLITSGNGAVQAVTTSAILLGILFYSAFFENLVGDSIHTKEDILLVIAPLGWLLVFGSVVEFILAMLLPDKSTHLSNKPFVFKKYIKGFYLKKNITMVKRKDEIYKAIIALGLFWSISQVLLAIFGEYAKTKLGVTNALVVQGIMALAVLGIIMGSILASSFSKYYINTGISALSSIGVVIILFLIPQTSSLIFLGVEFTLFGMFSGLIMVPLNAKIQFLSPTIHLGTILAGNNFIQTVFMFCFLMITTLFAYYGANAEMLFYLMSLVGVVLSYILMKKYLVMAFWSFWEQILANRHKYIYKGLQNIPTDKAVLLVGNHVSWIDWFILQLPIRKRINFMIDKSIYKNKYLNHMFRKAELIPISPRDFKDAFIEAECRLKEKHIVAIFAEGEISNSLHVAKFRHGYELIKRGDAVIIPFFIDGMFGSIFARFHDGSKRSIFRREVTTYYGKPISYDIKAEDLQRIVQGLKNEAFVN